MICDNGRCWREADVFIPGTPLAYCSSHALSGLGAWPAHEYRTLVAVSPDAYDERGSGAPAPGPTNQESLAAMLQVRGWTLQNLRELLEQNLEKEPK